MNCGCENTREIFPECDKTRWEVQCSSYIEDASNYYTKKQVDDLIESATTSGSCCITPEEVDEKIESAKTEIESEIPTVPTSNTAFTNDAGYLTEHQSLSAYSTTDEVNSAITQAVSGKQDTLSAGTNITIVDNVISATGGGSGVTSGEVQTMINEATSGLQQTLSAGTNVQIQSNVISATDTKYTAGDNITISNQNVISTITKFWCGTQAQYDQITTKDPNTVYMIHS